MKNIRLGNQHEGEGLKRCIVIPFFPRACSLPRSFDTMTELKIRVPSTTDLKKYYTVTIDTDLKIVSCDCLGFQFMKRCKHIRFLKSLIKALLHEHPSFLDEK